jgi:hypothetical protein
LLRRDPFLIFQDPGHSFPTFVPFVPLW